MWGGELEESHEKAVVMVRQHAEIKVRHEYDIVLTQGGRVAVNHYQAVKAACSVMHIIKPAGVIILVAHNGDAEPVGKKEYREVLRVLRKKGPGILSDLLKSSSWQFIPDQGEIQKLDQFFKKVGSLDRLIYCTDNIGPEELKQLPGRSGYETVAPRCNDMASIVQRAIDRTVALSHPKKKLRFAYVKDGPYAVPVL